MNQNMSDAWDLLDQVDDQQWDAAAALHASPDLDPDYMIDTFDLAFGEFSRVSRMGHYMVMARTTLFI